MAEPPASTAVVAFWKIDCERPVGYIQYYDASAGDPAWWTDKPGKGVLGIDQFLANPEQLNRGIGTAMVSEFVAYLMENPEVKEIRVDPHPGNLRAICCYEKVGFQKTGEIKTPDGRALKMILTRKH